MLLLLLGDGDGLLLLLLLRLLGEGPLLLLLALGAGAGAGRGLGAKYCTQEEGTCGRKGSQLAGPGPGAAGRGWGKADVTLAPGWRQCQVAPGAAVQPF